MKSVLSVLIELLISVKNVEGRTPKTTSWYGSMLNRFVALVGDPKLGFLALDHARRFVASLPSRTKRYMNHPVFPEKKGGLSPHTISCYVRTLKVFSRWPYEEGFTREDLSLPLKRPKLPQPVIQVLTGHEFARFSGHPPELGPFLGSSCCCWRTRQCVHRTLSRW